MRAYVGSVQDALARHAPSIRAEVVELAQLASTGLLGRALGMAAQHWRARRARRATPDLWHVLDGSQAHLARALGPAPVVVTVHDIIPQLQDRGRFPGVPRLGGAARLFWSENGRELRRAAALACDSHASARDAQDEYGIAAERCHFVPLALRPSIRRELENGLATPRRSGAVLHVGNNGFYKNRRGVLEIFALLGSSASRLFMAGPPPDPDLRAFAAELGIGERTEWLVDPDDATLARYYREASLMLFPSRYEGFGWPVLEAMAFGLPVVCSDAGSLPEVVGSAAPMHAPFDLAAFADSAARILTQPDAAASASASGLRRAAEFTSERFASGLLETYSAALQGAGGRA